jgi:serine protease AprX
LAAGALALALVAGPGSAAAEAKKSAGGATTLSTSTTTSTSSLDAATALSSAFDAAFTNSTGDLSANPPGGFEPNADMGSLYSVARIIGADRSFEAGYTGKGVDVAVIDTGVSPVPGLTSGNVVNGPDLSFDSVSPNLTNLDALGHGTHMASIIAGRDEKASPHDYTDDGTFSGIAPDARLVSLKVGASDGAVDVSQVIAAITWVTEHARTDGLDIRVLSLSYGTDARSWSLSDPLTYAVEQAWNAGIVVVVAGGNDGTANLSLANPAMDPRVIAVGASDARGTVATADDTVPAFSARGNPMRHVDLLAPGAHVAGLAVPGSVIAETYPGALVGGRYLRGSGTSQAAAVTAGAVALLLQRYPTLTPDQVKTMLVKTAHGADGTPSTFRGAGVLDVRAAQLATPPAVAVYPGYATGTGSLDAARGSSRVAFDGVELTGEQDIFGRPWNPATYAAKGGTRSTWNGGTWNGSDWTGTGWTGTSWTGQTWAGRSWTGRSWTGRSWTDATWSGRSWTGRSWTGDAWSGRSWSGRSWTDATWSGAVWQ